MQHQPIMQRPASSHYLVLHKMLLKGMMALLKISERVMTTMKSLHDRQTQTWRSWLGVHLEIAIQANRGYPMTKKFCLTIPLCLTTS